MNRNALSSCLFQVMVSCLFPVPVIAVERYVPSGYPTIQSAIDASNNGDAITISQGTYTGTGNRAIDFKGKAITVRSTDPSNPAVVAATVIDCQGAYGGFSFITNEQSNSILSGLTITNGYAENGAEVFCSNTSPTITNCSFIHGTAQMWGGGIFCGNSSAQIINCKFKLCRKAVNF